MSIKLVPMGDRILVRPEKDGETKSGLIIPETVKDAEKPQQGTVVAVGAGKEEDGVEVPMKLKKGDRVLYGKYSGAELKLDNEVYLMMRQDDVFGIVKE